MSAEQCFFVLGFFPAVENIFENVEDIFRNQPKNAPRNYTVVIFRQCGSFKAQFQFLFAKYDTFSHFKEKKLFLLRRNLGGSYGYVLGYIVDGKLMGIKNKGRSKYALQADAPQIGQDGRLVSSNHGGRGFNVLFEDGHVRFVLLTGRTQKKNILEDDFLVNDRVHVSAGCHEDDSVFGDSTASPLPESYSGIQIEDL